MGEVAGFECHLVNEHAAIPFPPCICSKSQGMEGFWSELLAEEADSSGEAAVAGITQTRRSGGAGMTLADRACSKNPPAPGGTRC